MDKYMDSELPTHLSIALLKEPVTHKLHSHDYIDSINSEMMMDI